MGNKRAAYRLGLKAEKIAALYLRLKGYRILAERYRILQGEIDLLARKGKTLAAVEVKARKTLEACEESIAPWKQRKIAAAMQHVISGGGGKIAGLGDAQALNIRFDAVWIVPRRWPKHIKDAWRP